MLSRHWEGQWVILAIKRADMEMASLQNGEHTPTCVALHVCGSLTTPNPGEWTLPVQMPRLSPMHMAWTVKSRHVHFRGAKEDEETLVSKRHEKWVIPELLAMEVERLLAAQRQEEE